jgi:hypothetical protein
MHVTVTVLYYTKQISLVRQGLRYPTLLYTVQTGLHRVLVPGQHASGSQRRQFGYHGAVRNDRLVDRVGSHESVQSGAGTFDRGGRLEATTDEQYMVQRHGSLLTNFQKLCHGRRPKRLQVGGRRHVR